jgi:hypothetical protein
MAADDFPRAFNDVVETVIRRIGGNAQRTEEVDAVVEFDVEGGGHTDDGRGRRRDLTGMMDIAAGQATTANDTWVIGGELYHQVGEPTSKDGATKTVQLIKRSGMRAREPRVSGGRN